MITVAKDVQCTAKPDARAWQNNGSAGITYKIGISDGKSNVELKCESDVYEKFVVGERYDVALNVTQHAQNNVIVERVRVVDCQMAG